MNVYIQTLFEIHVKILVNAVASSWANFYEVLFLWQFLPARKVKEKSRSLKDSLSEDMFSSTNILALTFRQVVLQQLWSFELRVFKPGVRRDMNDLANAREVR